MTARDKHWDPAVVQLIERARAEGAAEIVARVEAIVPVVALDDPTHTEFLLRSGVLAALRGDDR